MREAGVVQIPLKEAAAGQIRLREIGPVQVEVLGPLSSPLRRREIDARRLAFHQSVDHRFRERCTGQLTPGKVDGVQFRIAKITLLEWYFPQTRSGQVCVAKIDAAKVRQERGGSRVGIKPRLMDRIPASDALFPTKKKGHCLIQRESKQRKCINLADDLDIE